MKAAVTVSDVKQFLYCPKIVYFDHVLHVPKPPDQKLETGKEEHHGLTAKERRRRGAVFYDPELDSAEKLFRVALESSNLGLRGVLDVLIKTEREYIPVDYKFGRSNHGGVHLNHKYQVAAYALLVEDSFSTIVRRFYVLYSRDKVNARIDFSDEVRRRTLKMVEGARRIIEEEIEPPGTRNPGRCTDCEYRRYCEGALI